MLWIVDGADFHVGADGDRLTVDDLQEFQVDSQQAEILESPADLFGRSFTGRAGIRNDLNAQQTAQGNDPPVRVGAFVQKERSFDGVEGHSKFGRFNPGVADFRVVQSDFAKVRRRDGTGGEDVGGRVQYDGGIRRQQIARVMVAAIRQIGQGVAELLENGDAGIVSVEIGPGRGRQRFQTAQPLVAQLRIVQRRGDILVCGRRGGISHNRNG